VILLDLALPDSQGLDTFSKVRAHAPDVPIVVLTGLRDDRVAAEVLEAGGQDYLVKGALNYAVLERSIRSAIRRKRAQGESRPATQAAGADDRSLASLGEQLRGPLTPALATVSALIDQPGTAADLRPALAAIREQLEQELRLIDNLLA
jgi:DNA-binding response OmpR family regulator